MTIKLGQISVGLKFKPFIVAEMSGNHNRSLQRALKIVDAAVYAGASAIKLQTYTADTITINSNRKEFLIKNKKNIWNGKNLYQLYKEASTPWEWHQKIFNYCKKKKILCFSAPFDESAVDFLEKLNTPVYKIASFENNHIPLIKKVSLTGKPVIISTGMASLNEIKEAVSTAKKNGCKKIILLKCTSSYPAKPSSSNILTIPELRKKFNCEVGLSDHTLGLGVPLASIALGATLIEKHITLSKSDFGVDSEFSTTPEELKTLVIQSNLAWQSVGKVKFGTADKLENYSKKFRRSIYVIQDIKKGEKFNKFNIKVIRPANGLHPRNFFKVIGKKSKKKIIKGTPLSFNMI